MAVEIKYVVVRKGEEKMTFASKKEADAYDKMLDMAEAFADWLSQSPLEMDEAQAEALGLHLAEQKDAVQHILRTSKLPEAADAAQASGSVDAPAAASAAAESTADDADGEQPEASDEQPEASKTAKKAKAAVRAA